MKTLILSLGILACTVGLKGQTVIEMMYPGDATVVLLQVTDVNEADIVVFRTENKDEANEWDCKWKFKKWGFSNFSVYVSENINDSLLVDEDFGRIEFDGKIAFTQDATKRGYKNKDFRLEGVFRKVSSDDVEW